MRISEFTISNYRSIARAKSIVFKDKTVLVGKNNEGKSNIIRALNVAIYSLQHYDRLYGRKHINQLRYTSVNDSYETYNFEYDFPKNINVNTKKTKLTLTFELNKEEIAEFYKEIQSNINGILKISLEFDEDNVLTAKIKKKGPTAKQWNDTKVNKIIRFVSSRISINYITAVRNDENPLRIIRKEMRVAFDQLTNKKEFKNLEKELTKLYEEKLEELSIKYTDQVKEWLPNIQSIQIKPELSLRQLLSRNMDLIISDDISETNIEFKGDGIKSLLSIALLQNSPVNDVTEFLAIDEPEAHLHPGAIRKLNSTLNDISKKQQVIISTHNPILINTGKLQV